MCYKKITHCCDKTKNNCIVKSSISIEIVSRFKPISLDVIHQKDILDKHLYILISKFHINYNNFTGVNG